MIRVNMLLLLVVFSLGLMNPGNGEKTRNLEIPEKIENSGNSKIPGSGEINTFAGPSGLAFSEKANRVFIALQNANRIDILDLKRKKVTGSIATAGQPNKVYLSDENKLIVLEGMEDGRLLVYNPGKLKKEEEIAVGHSPVDIVETGDDFIICNRFPGEISFINKKKGKTEKILAVGREPVAMVLMPEKDKLLIAHHLPEMASTAAHVAAKITLVDTREKTILKTFLLPNGSSGVKDIALSPDGKHAFVTHILARFHLPTTQLERGWMNTNALSVIEVDNMRLWKTVLLDDVDHGAANPWDVDCSPGGRTIYVTHSGTHEISIIDWKSMRDSLLESDPGKSGYDYSGRRHEQSDRRYDVSEDLGFIYPFRLRIPLQGNGPRSMVLAEDHIVTANFFSQDLSLVHAESHEQENISLGTATMTREQKGEKHFYDASLCFQNWQSCASCHPDGRVDGLNWDLLNDGIGNPKNAKSLLLSHETPPVMSLGVRAKAEVAVRAGFKYIQFVEVPEAYTAEVDAYLKAMKPVSGPAAHEDVRKGKALFESLNCNSCHPGPHYTNLKSYPLGSDSKMWDTPTLVELWRTGPYWHDGRYDSLRDLFEEELHGLEKPLESGDRIALENYLLSL